MIRLNCDMGESFGIWKMGADEQIMPYISLANLACGFHASDAVTMNRSVELAKKYNVTIGAHPSYQDLVGFGRRSISCSLEEIKSKVLYQLGALYAFCKSHGTTVAYVKPHGALYNDMMRDQNIYKAILSAVAAFDKNIKLMILSNPNNEAFEYTAKMYGITLIYEVFADRNYNDDGTLVSRMLPNAVITDELEIMQRVKTLKEYGFLESINSKRLYLKADTICVHGDTEDALNFIKSLYKVLN
ncbi:5-oxoprolinase subunit PxpA [Halarcobacter anaerophilus]|uniref:5-oxoprolinase subunit PxpA n=1 Tax=Halarcobacter anaerophilus TaxID=877500 RepID=UPI0005C91C34|nr:5-oxoprolinase subunit PxpA [Halarcobacter anaerophilus]